MSDRASWPAAYRENRLSRARGRSAALPQKKWGPASLPAPTAPSEGYAGVRNLVRSDPKANANPFSILAHQLRRRIASDRSLRGRSPAPLLDCAARGFAGLPSGPAGREAKPSDVPRPFLGRSLVRPASLLTIRRPLEAASRLRKIDSSGASSRLAPHPLPKEHPHCLPAEIGPLVPAAPFLPLPAVWRGRDRRPDHKKTMHPAPESRKRKIREEGCG